MNCYELHPGLTPKNRGLSCTLTSDQRYRHIRDVTKPGERKNFFLNIGHDEDWRFTPEMRETFADLLVMVRLKENEPLPDVIGDVAATFPFRDQGQPVLLSPKIREMLRQFDQSQFEFVPAGPMIDLASMREIEDHGFVYVSFLDDRDTYDRERSKIKIVKQHRGDREFYHVRSPTSHVAERIGDGVIWREALNGKLMCSDRFLEAFESVGGVGIEFFPMEVSGAE